MAEKKKEKQAESTETQASQRRKVFYIGLGATFLVLLLWAAGVFTRLELIALDLRFLVRGEREAVVPMAIVAIDDESLNVWSDENNVTRRMPERWTWPRGFYGQVVRNLKKAGAELVAFDMTFSESSNWDKEGDQKFAEACKAAGNVVLVDRYVAKKLEGGQTAIKQETLIKVLAAAKRDKGNANVFPDQDGFQRSFRLFIPASDGQMDPDRINLDVAVLRQHLFGKAVAPTMEGDEMVFRDNGKEHRVSHDGTGRTEVNFLGPPGSVPTFNFHDVYFETMEMSVFKDRVVYVGSSSDILHDNHRTPFSSEDSMMPGVEIHAHFLDTLVSRQFLRTFPGMMDLALILGLGILTSFLTFRVRPLLGALVAGMILALFLTIAVYLFVGARQVIPMAAPTVSILLSFVSIAVYRGRVEELLARRTKAMFSRYVSHQIVDEIMRNPGAVKLGGELKEVAILFSDVRGFTAMSEKLSAPEVVEVLNEYLTRMVDIVIANGGTLDKYVGDAVMAVWGSPLPDPKHNENAVRSAVLMMEVLQELRAKWKLEGKPEIDIGIGVNSGKVVAGNMGHPEYKMDYTVIGDEVNLAARLESANKELKAHVLISGSTYADVANLVDVIQHPDIHVKGKEKAVQVYEVTGWKGQGRADWAVPLKGK